MANPENVELGQDASIFQRLERLERHAFGRALHDPVDENEVENTDTVPEDERVTHSATPNATPVTSSETPTVSTTVGE